MPSLHYTSHLNKKKIEKAIYYSSDKVGPSLPSCSVRPAGSFSQPWHGCCVLSMSGVLVMGYMNIRISTSAFSLALPIIRIQPVCRNQPFLGKGSEQCWEVGGRERSQLSL